MSERTRRTPSANAARSEPASRTMSSTSPAGRFDTWRVSGRVVALSVAVTTRLQPVCLAIALSASRTVPRGWSMETTGALSGRRPVSRPPSPAAASVQPDSNTRATPTTNSSLSALIPISLHPRVRSSVRLISCAPGIVPDDEDHGQDGRGRAQDGQRPDTERHEGNDRADTGCPSHEIGHRLREPPDGDGRLDGRAQQHRDHRQTDERGDEASQDVTSVASLDRLEISPPRSGEELSRRLRRGKRLQQPRELSVVRSLGHGVLVPAPSSAGRGPDGATSSPCPSALRERPQCPGTTFPRRGREG